MTHDSIRVAVCGAGAMGSGIAQVAAQAGALVTLFDVHAPSLEASRNRISDGLQGQVTKGRMAQADADAVLARMQWTAELADLAASDLVIEAIVEDVAAKQALFARLEDVVGAGAILATNTSSLPIGRLARDLRHPERFAGMHFFNPATAMKLVEVVAGTATDAAVVDRIEALAAAWGKVAVRVADVPGFIVNRVARPFYAEAFRAMQEGAAEPVVIDHLFKASAGFRMGPLELTDLIGQDVNFAVARSVHEASFGVARFVPQQAQAALVDAGWLGRKTGRGVYDYRGAATPLPQPHPACPPADPVPEASGLPFTSGGVLVRMTRGRTARSEARDCGQPVALLDWFDPATATAIAFSASDDAAAVAAASVIAGWGNAAFRLADRPGLLVARTLAQIANAAGDAVHERVADAAGIDAALRFGANYPFGPFAFAERFGAAALVELLANIAAATGAAMYHPSEYWSARADD